MPRNYQDELKTLVENANFWKPKQGKYLVVVLDEPEDSTYTNDKGEVQQQWKMKVTVDGAKEQTWTVPKSNSPTSIRGQLVKLGAKKGTLKNIGFDLIVQGENKQRKYIIPEVL